MKHLLSLVIVMIGTTLADTLDTVYNIDGYYLYCLGGITGILSYAALSIKRG